MSAHITYYSNAQKIPNLFHDLLTDHILTDITERITGQRRYTVTEITTSYNRGRLIILEYLGMRYYVSLSEIKNEGRNSSLQSVPTALNLFYSDSTPNKRLMYYFLPHEGNLFTDYHILYYRMMMTAGIEFLNLSDFATYVITPYDSIDSLIQERNNNRSSNRGNNSSFVTRTTDRVQIFGKVYGANKYESTILGIAISHLTSLPIDLYSVAEQDLVDLPASSKTTLNSLGVNLYQTSLQLNNELNALPNAESLRDAAYSYNLFERIGYKKCAICNCLIPEIIQGAHVWPVADIKRNENLPFEAKYHHATSGHNGIWLCQNHHKLFDSNIIVINGNGDYMVKRNLPGSHVDYIRESTIETSLSPDILSDNFVNYLNIRNSHLNFDMYERISI